MDPITAPDARDIQRPRKADTPSETPVSSTPPKPAGRKRLGTADLKKQRPRRTKLVYLPGHDGEVEVAEVRPGELAEINAKCIIHTPEEDGGEKVDWDGRRRSFYLIAKALRNEQGQPVYQGDNYLYGAEIVANEFDNEEHELLIAAVNEVSGLTKEARETAKKG